MLTAYPYVTLPRGGGQTELEHTKTEPLGVGGELQAIAGVSSSSFPCYPLLVRWQLSKQAEPDGPDTVPIPTREEPEALKPKRSSRERHPSVLSSNSYISPSPWILLLFPPLSLLITCSSCMGLISSRPVLNSLEQGSSFSQQSMEPKLFLHMDTVCREMASHEVLCRLQARALVCGGGAVPVPVPHGQ